MVIGIPRPPVLPPTEFRGPVRQTNRLPEISRLSLEFRGERPQGRLFSWPAPWPVGCAGERSASIASDAPPSVSPSYGFISRHKRPHAAFGSRGFFGAVVAMSLGKRISMFLGKNGECGHTYSRLPALPGRVRMGEHEIGIHLLGDPLISSELLSVVGRERTNAGGKGRQQGDHRLRDGLCRLEPHRVRSMSMTIACFFPAPMPKSPAQSQQRAAQRRWPDANRWRPGSTSCRVAHVFRSASCEPSGSAGSGAGCRPPACRHKCG